MAFAEAYYYTWDLYNPHEDEFKHNVVLHTHRVLPTQISFEGKNTPVTLPQGEYNMMAFAEAYYYTWDLYNPHEDEFKHNVVLHPHRVLPTQISFEGE